MARKRTLDRRALRSDFDESEGRQSEEVEDRDEEEEEDGEEEEEEEEEGESDEEGDAEGDGDDEEKAPKSKNKTKKTSSKATSKPRTRAAKVVRMKVTWGVFNNSNQQVESFPYSQKAEAEAYAAKLANDKKQTHFVQSVKKPFDEKEK